MVNFQAIEKKWQQRWQKAKLFVAKENPKKKKFYCVEMFSYPSAPAVHVGHIRNYTLSDTVARFKRMQGYNVLYPIGFDAFGLPAENYAIKHKIHPEKSTYDNIRGIGKQLKSIGFSYDWSRETITCTPEYYRWNQWLFLKMYEKGLAYRKKSEVNWCPSCHTVLANEQVINGACWRCKSTVEPKLLEQWFFRITNYAEELDYGLEQLAWPERVKLMQKNWIGKSRGIEIYFLEKETKRSLPVFTTRPDTIFGVACIIIAPEHPVVLELVQGTKHEIEIKKFIEKVKREDKETRTTRGKEGMFIGKYAINPINNEEVPIYIANFVLQEYGTGMIMCVPAHDERDFDFAKKYSLPITFVIKPKDQELNTSKAYLEEGILCNSGEFSNLENEQAKVKITEYLERKDLAKQIIHYRLRDWLISRQRYWGTPIPITYCGRCGILPVPEKDLPIKLPKNVKFTGKGNPLDHAASFVHTTCHKCRGKARRETDTMDTFVDSSWYFLRYLSPNEKRAPVKKEAANYWMSVDQYIGGIEHATGHLMYARFFTKAMRDLKLITVDEPFKNLLCNGMVTLGGKAMSKSLGNVVSPSTVIGKYSIDTLRVYELAMASPEKDLEWSDESVNGVYRFLNRVYGLLEQESPIGAVKDKYLISKLHTTIKNVTIASNNLQFHNAINALIQFVNILNKNKTQTSKKVYKEACEKIILLMAPFAPHLAEEMWEKIGKKPFVATAPWPSYNEQMIDHNVEALETILSNTVVDIQKVINLTRKKPSTITLFIAEPWKYELFKKLNHEQERDFNTLIKKVMDKEHWQETAKIVQSFLKGSIRTYPTAKKDDECMFNENKDELKKIFNAAVHIVAAESSDEQKAKNALPGKPAILLS